MPQREWLRAFAEGELLIAIAFIISFRGGGNNVLLPELREMVLYDMRIVER
jgi:hypothetical protein